MATKQITKEKSKFDDTLLNEYDINNTDEKSMDSTLEKPTKEKAVPEELKNDDESNTKEIQQFRKVDLKELKK